ncbi:Fic family protein [Candidatus Woesebacteria bacterium]|nr:Fic family protein [Candidatus Woesebacteria bacterium]
MPYTPKYAITNKLLTLVGSVDAAREVITTAPLVPAWERKFQNEARIRTIHHGTHLEGNNLNLDEVEKIVDEPDRGESLARERDIREVINYREVMDYIDFLKNELEQSPSPSLTEGMLKEIHKKTVSGILNETEAGSYRTLRVVIRNTTTGEVTFRPPAPPQVPTMITDFFAWLSSDEAELTHPLIKAGLIHAELVRIHPFTDGNGRATRALSLLLLLLEGYEIKKFFSLDEYYDQDPQAYYDALKSVEITGDLTAWLEYFVLGISIEFNRVKSLVQKLSLDLHLKETIGGKQIALSDRQIRLVEYLEKYVSLGMAEARDLLPDVSDDTILRDLRDLVDKKLISRRGNTKGAKYYLSNSKNS